LPGPAIPESDSLPKHERLFLELIEGQARLPVIR
jgi:hypothetical protein